MVVLRLLAALFCLHAATAHAKSYEDIKGNPLSVKLGISIPSLNMELRERHIAQLDALEYVPHTRSSTYLSVAYDWWGFSVSSVNATADEDDRMKGKSKAQDWQFRFNFEKTSYEFFYQNYQGYFLEDHPSQPRAVNAPYLQFPDMRTEHFGANFLYNWNPDDFSIAAVMDQTERQNHSSWAWLLGASVHGMRFANPTSIVPTALQSTFGEFNNVRSGRLYSTLAGAGLGGTWVPAEKFYVSGLAVVYFGVEKQSIESTTEDYEYFGTTSKIHMKMSVGYNGDQWVSGVQANSDAAKYNVRNAEMNFMNMAIQLFVGRRFDL
ncbi:MAG: DUF4421 family protein [Bdellovibrionaceae bacterium]|nr:DUF4421 family protein [Pseudobdellovibrionaceae bacterium]